MIDCDLFYALVKVASSARREKLVSLTSERRPPGQNGDGVLRSPLLVSHRVNFGSPRVAAEPLEVAGFVSAHGRLQKFSTNTHNQKYREKFPSGKYCQIESKLCCHKVIYLYYATCNASETTVL